jgi:segregation and condensation protein B
MSKSLKLIIEALLFASDKPLTYKEIQVCLPDVKIADIKNTLEVLQYEYDSMQRSFTLKEVAGGFQFRSHSEYGQYILKMLQVSPTRLSQAALETMAIIAYKQPIIRQEIERLRGVDSGGVLKMLLEKDLIKIMGRKDLPGRPLIYGTTKKFLEVFDLKDIDSLPKLKEIKSLGPEDEEPGPIPPENPDDLTQSMAQVENRVVDPNAEDNGTEPAQPLTYVEGIGYPEIPVPDPIQSHQNHDDLSVAAPSNPINESSEPHAHETQNPGTVSDPEPDQGTPA